MIRRRLEDHVVVCDGAMGSELLDRLPAGALLDLAPVEHPHEVLEVHLAYLEAGAELIETCTFAASRPRLERDRAGDRFEEVNSRAVKIAREAREISGRDALVAGSIGPLAGVLDLDEPEGPDLIADAHQEQASILAGRGADLLILETFFRTDELELAVQAVRRVTDLPLIGLLTFATERPPHQYREQGRILDRLAGLDLLAVGINCSPGPMGAIEILEAADKLAGHPEVDGVYINSNPLARLRMDSLSLAQEVQRRTGLETVPHITPRDASLMGLQSQLLGAWMGGIRNVFAVSGDPSQLGDYPGVHDVYHVNIFELVRSLSRMVEGFDCAGNRIGDPPSFLIGVAVNPNVDDLEYELSRFRRKVDAGAHFGLTQVIFDWKPWERFLDLCGGAPPIPTLVAVWPLRSLKMALRLHHEVPPISLPLSRGG